MANRANLIATYNSNPTLQSRYTLPQYLAMFGFGQTTTPPPTTPTPTPDPTPGIPNIINQNLNPGSGGDGGPINIPERKQYFEKTYTGATFPDGTPIMSGFEETEGPGFFQGIANAFDTLGGLYQKYSPVGMIGKAIQDRKDFKQAQTNKALEQVAMQQAIRDAEAAAAANLANAQRRGRRPTAPRGSGIQDSQSLGNESAGQTGGYSYDSGGRQGFGYGLADGGRVYLYNRLK
tara:strand:+ start:139 stop:840 length:702 start_codon:yes stop_codon:yes gene_type:complete